MVIFVWDFLHTLFHMEMQTNDAICVGLSMCIWLNKVDVIVL